MKRLFILTTLLLTLLSGLSLAEPQWAQAQTFSCSNVTEIPTSECNELVTLYNSTGGANWKNNTGWLTTNTPCSWFGLTCSAGQVSKINLFDDNNTPSGTTDGNNLVGTIPNLNLPNLTELVLTYNQLSGTIPDFSNMPNLVKLWLFHNELSGNVPNFTNLPNLADLYLDTNQLSGEIPNFNNLPKLANLGLDYNRLSGNIPNFTNLPNLIGLYLHHNQLSGNIPNFSNLPNLTKLGLDYNQLSGSIPNLTWSSFNYLKLNNNCGLVAFDTAQAMVLNSKDTDWQVRNPACAGTSVDVHYKGYVR